MKEEIAENKLLRLLKESKVDKGKETLPSNGSSLNSNKLLSLLRAKQQQDINSKQDTVTPHNINTSKASCSYPDSFIASETAKPPSTNIRGTLHKHEIYNSDRSKSSGKITLDYSALSVVQLYVFITRQELDLLEKLTQEASSFSTLLYLIFGHNLMARQIPSRKDLSSHLSNYMRQQNAVLHRLLVKDKLGQEVVFGKQLFPEQDRLQTCILDGLILAMQQGKEMRIPSLSVEKERLILVSSLTPERLKFFQKLSQERKQLGLVLHLFFSHLLMAQEVVVQSAGQLAQTFAINELLAKYRMAQDTLLNRLLLATRMQKPINLKEKNLEQLTNLQKLLAEFRKLIKG